MYRFFYTLYFLERLIILGSGSALPANGRNPSAQILEHNGKFLLIDCGEGTQNRLRQNKISFNKISHIFISHLHGDHYFGLAGLLSTMQLLGRKNALNLYAPQALKDILDLQFKTGGTFLSFPLNFVAIDGEFEFKIDDQLNARTITLNHRISCFGFVFSEQPKPRRINGELVKYYNVPHYEMQTLRKGADFTTLSGELIKNEVLTLPPKASNSYAYCSDNRIKPDFEKKIRDCSVIYHESTFLHKDLDRAKKTFHSTAKEAAVLGGKVLPKALLIGHFSARYNDLHDFLQEAKLHYVNTILATEGLIYKFE